MADGRVGVRQQAGADRQIDNEVLTVGGQTVYRQRVAIPDPVATTPPANGSTTGTINGVGQSVTLALPAGTSATDFQLTGPFVGTVIFETSLDGGATYNARVYRSTGILNNLQTNTSTFPSEWRGNSAGMTHVRVRCTAYTSGTLTVVIASAASPGAVFLNAAIPIGGQSVGNAYNASLAAGVTFTGAWENLEHVASVAVDVMLNQAGSIQVQYSQDGSSVFSSDPARVLAAGVGKYFVVTPRAQYVRFLLTNTSASLASQARLEVIYRAVATAAPAIDLGSTSDISDNLLAPVGVAVMTGRQAAGVYVPAKVDGNGHQATRIGVTTGVPVTVAGLAAVTLAAPVDVTKRVRLRWIEVARAYSAADSTNLFTLRWAGGPNIYTHPIGYMPMFQHAVAREAPSVNQALELIQTVNETLYVNLDWEEF